MPTSFCPNCWKQIDGEETVCPHCSSRVDEYDALTYETKLIRALEHPIRENRMLAIQLLGDLRSTAALPAFESIIRSDGDFYVLREVALALSKIGTEQGRDLLDALKDHQSNLVRRFSRQLPGGPGLGTVTGAS